MDGRTSLITAEFLQLMGTLLAASGLGIIDCFKERDEEFCAMPSAIRENLGKILFWFNLICELCKGHLGFLS